MKQAAFAILLTIGSIDSLRAARLEGSVGITLSNDLLTVRSPAHAQIVDSHGNIDWFVTISGVHRITQGTPAVDFEMSYTRTGHYLETFEAPSRAGSCYDAILSADTAVTSEARWMPAGPFCRPNAVPPPPPGCTTCIPTTCDPGHDCVEGEREPLILDLNGDGIHTTAPDVRFDISGDGIEDVTAWTNGATEEGLLYYDSNHNGTVDGGGELFGDVGAVSGVAALQSRDRNGDGSISPADAAWGMLRVWIDRDHDGQVTSDENYALGQLGIIELSLTFSDVPRAEATDASGNWHRYQGTFRQAVGTGANREIVTRALHDVYFRVSIRR